MPYFSKLYMRYDPNIRRLRLILTTKGIPQLNQFCLTYVMWANWTGWCYFLMIVAFARWRCEKSCFCGQGNVHSEYILHDRTVIILRCLRKYIRRKRSLFWQTGDWYILYVHAYAQLSKLVKHFLIKTRTHELPHSQYSP